MHKRLLLHRIMFCAAIAMLAIGVVELFNPRERGEGAVVAVVGAIVGLTAFRALRNGDTRSRR